MNSSNFLSSFSVIFQKLIFSPKLNRSWKKSQSNHKIIFELKKPLSKTELKQYFSKQKIAFKKINTYYYLNKKRVIFTFIDSNQIDSFLKLVYA